MKIVRENIEFERGRDPRSAMKIGSKEILKSDILGRQSGWTLPEKQRPSDLLELDPDDVYILGFAGETDKDEYFFNDYTQMLEDTCNEGKLLSAKNYGENGYNLYQTKFGRIVRAMLDEEGLYYYGDLESALNIGIQNIPQGERESIF